LFVFVHSFNIIYNILFKTDKNFFWFPVIYGVRLGTRYMKGAIYMTPVLFIELNKKIC